MQNKILAILAIGLPMGVLNSAALPINAKERKALIKSDCVKKAMSCMDDFNTKQREVRKEEEKVILKMK